jgi:phenylalanyl-tRNA synthetase alpha chain
VLVLLKRASSLVSLLPKQQYFLPTTLQYHQRNYPKEKGAQPMKMYIEPISKKALKNYLAITDLTQSPNPHAIKMVYEKIEQYMCSTHPQSDVQVYRKNPIVAVIDNYDNLLIMPDNVSRSSTYTHYVDEDHVLRTHTSAHLPGILRELSQRNDWEDVLILLPGLAYRRDVSDKNHVSEVHMLEMWRVVKNAARQAIAKNDLLEVVEGVAATAAPGWKLRIIDSPHPYTNGGIEVNAVQGDRDIEILECGLIKDQILANAGLDPATHSGWALGMGLDRLVMTLKNIHDVRYLRSTNPRIAEQMTNLETYYEVSSQPAIKRDLSYSVPLGYVEEDISADIREALGDQLDTLESVEVLNQTPYSTLPPAVRERLGCSSSQKNVLVRITLRHLERSITNHEANQIYEKVYAKINKGTGGYT